MQVAATPRRLEKIVSQRFLAAQGNLRSRCITRTLVLLGTIVTDTVAHTGRASESASATSSSSKLLFLDYDAVANMNETLELRMHQPKRAFLQNGGRVIWQEHPWENYAIFAYGSVMTAADGQRRIYYSCDSGRSEKQPLERTYQRTCVAVSDDGIHWTKPKLGLIKDPLTGSTANNLVWPPNYMDPDNPCDNCAGLPCPCPFTSMAFHETGTVFLDTKPGVPASERYKMICNAEHPKNKSKIGVFALASPDGFANWTFMSERPGLADSDTCNVGFYDERYGEYVMYVRWDGAPCQVYKDPNCTVTIPGRSVARVTATDLAGEWSSRVLTGLALTDKLHASYDVYTNMATKYEGAYVFFPSIYYHFSSDPDKSPNGLPNDGLWDTRLAVSRDGKDIYSPGGKTRLARYGSSPFVDHGVNRCRTVGSIKHPGGWCSYKDKSLAQTAWDTSMTAVLSGYFISGDGNEIYLYKYGAAMTHQGGHQPATWSNNTNTSLPNTGIELVTLRRDGFVSVDAPLIESPGFGHAGEQTVKYPGNVGELPTLTTAIPMQVPRCPIPQLAKLFANCQTSMVGSIYFELRISGSVTQRSLVSAAEEGTAEGLLNSSWVRYHPVAGFTLQDSDFLKGNYINKAVSWGGGNRTGLSAAFAGQKLGVRVAMNDASLYSLEVRCE